MPAGVRVPDSPGGAWRKNCGAAAGPVPDCPQGGQAPVGRALAARVPEKSLTKSVEKR
jgi:hypothetical protein